MNAYIIRGVSGSGKSTFAESLGCPVVSADDYFGPEYKFDHNKLKEAHADCFQKFCNLLNGNNVAVANTFTQEWEFLKYKREAEIRGYKVFCIVLENRHGGQNIHGVPNKVIQNQKDRFEIKL